MPAGGLPPVERTDDPARISPTRGCRCPTPSAWASKVAIDTANGATTTVAPRLFSELGFDLTVIGDQPDGRNINLDCGSTHPEAQRAGQTGRPSHGVAFDGDGDRAIFVDHEGRVVDGDAVMLICARHMKSQGRLTATPWSRP